MDSSIDKYTILINISQNPIDSGNNFQKVNSPLLYSLFHVLIDNFHSNVFLIVIIDVHNIRKYHLTHYLH